MPVQQIRMDRDNVILNLKNILSIAVERGHGNINDLRCVDRTAGKQLERLIKDRLINVEYTKYSKNYSITDLGREYFAEFFADIKK